MAKISARGDEKYCEIISMYGLRGVITKKGRILYRNGHGGFLLYGRAKGAAGALEMMEQKGWVRV